MSHVSNVLRSLTLRVLPIHCNVLVLPTPLSFFFFFFNDTATTKFYPLPLHDALPISALLVSAVVLERLDGRHEHGRVRPQPADAADDVEELLHAHVRAEAALGDDVLAELERHPRSEEHTSELQSPCNLVCRLLLEKKN